MKYSPEGETVLFRISKSTEPEKRMLGKNILDNPAFHVLTFEVINTGATTIRTTQQERLFESFNRLSRI